ncbi:Uncharacterised protein [Serratia ficaria]|uniref:hypothetical protein n=1 Tax=Serratia ficaria TaxID=61651 RepID=UPI0012B96DDD|nr:hypothetical protein [Serratia ficaria]CAI1891581.1 Uncharacterised protein [Serratia ficaria]
MRTTSATASIILGSLLCFTCAAATLTSAIPANVQGQVSLGNQSIVNRDTLLFTTDLNDESCISGSTLALRITGLGAQTLPLSIITPSSIWGTYSFNGEYSFINTCPESISGTWRLEHNNSGTSEVIATQTFTLPPAVVCSMTIPDAIDLGSFTAEQIKNGVTTDEKLRLAGQCATNFTLTIAGNGSSDGNYLLGDDVKMALAYNYGANPIVNGQPFSPASSQIVDIKLSSATGSTPVAGEKKTALTVTLALP